mgnify:CR=1 FL=1
MSSSYTIEGNTPFVIKARNQTGQVLLPIWILLFIAWGYFQTKFIILFSRSFMALVNAEPREGIKIIYNPPYLEQIIETIIWTMFISAFIIGVALGFLFGIFVLQEILWRTLGTETIEISKEQIIWSRQIPFVRLAKKYPISSLLKIKVLLPENIEIKKLDKIRPMLVLFRGMGSGAISLQYEKETIGIFGLIKSMDAEIILKRLKDLSYIDLPIEV